MGRKKRKKERFQTWRCTLSQVAAVSLENTVLLAHGMSLAFPTLLIPELSGKYNGQAFSLDEEGISWIGSINLICVPFGCLISGFITQLFGRRRSTQLTNIPFITAWLLYYFSTEIWHIFAALAISGVGGGLIEAPVVTYAVEITQPHLRGVLCSTSPLSVIAGITLQFILGSFLQWRSVALCSVLVPIISFFLLFLIPETPLWLLSKKQYVEAQKGLAWLRGWVSIKKVDKEYQEMASYIQISRGIENSGLQPENDENDSNRNVRIQGDEEEKEKIQVRKETKMEMLKLLKKRSFIWPFILISYLFFLSHFTGITPIQTYAVDIFTSFKNPLGRYFATALLGIANLCGCIICASLVGIVGKRVLYFVSLGGTAACLLIVGIYAHLFHVTILLDSDNISISNSSYSEMQQIHSEVFSWIPMILIISCAFFSHIGIRTLPWILVGEVFPHEIRAVASGVAGISFYIFGFICNKLFLSMVSVLALSVTILFYSLMSFMGLTVLYFALPETEGKTLQDIIDHFAGKLKIDNNVYRRTKSKSRTNDTAHNNELYETSKIDSEPL